MASPPDMPARIAEDRPPLSVVIPAFNEGDGLLLALDEVLQHVLSMVPEAEVIVVDDGSTDGTADRLSTLSPAMPPLRSLRQENAGHGVALRTGIDAARGDALLLLDADRQISLDRFGTHWRSYHDEPLDALLGIRTPRHDPAHRLLITRIMRRLIRAQFGRSPKDGGVPYKLLSRAAWEVCAARIPRGSAIPSVLLAILLLNTQDLRVAEVPVIHRARSSGRSVLRWGRLYRLCRDATGDILSLSRSNPAQGSTTRYADPKLDAIKKPE